MVSEVYNCCIEVFCDINPWMDCIFVVAPTDRARALEVLSWAYDTYFEKELEEPYGDYFCRILSQAEILFNVFYAPDPE